jgi:hypothetical protein
MYRRCDCEKIQVLAEACEDLWTECFEYSSAISQGASLQNVTINIKVRFPYGRNGCKNRVTVFRNGQFTIVYTCKPHIKHKHSLVIITPDFFSSKILYFGWWERLWHDSILISISKTINGLKTCVYIVLWDTLFMNTGWGMFSLNAPRQ